MYVHVGICNLLECEVPRDDMTIISSSGIARWIYLVILAFIVLFIRVNFLDCCVLYARRANLMTYIRSPHPSTPISSYPLSCFPSFRLTSSGPGSVFQLMIPRMVPRPLLSVLPRDAAAAVASMPGRDQPSTIHRPRRPRRARVHRRGRRRGHPSHRP